MPMCWGMSDFSDCGSECCIITAHSKIDLIERVGWSVMRNVLVRRVGLGLVLAALLVAGGCRKHRKTASAPNTDAYADKLHDLVAKKALPPEKVDTTKVRTCAGRTF